MYELPKEERAKAIDALVQLLPDAKRAEAVTAVNGLADLFEGQDLNTVGVLYRAAEAGRFDEYAARLKEYHASHGRHVPVAERSAARNQNIAVLRDIVAKETEIADGSRPRSDRSYWPHSVQNLAKHLGSVRMELFFADCFKDIMRR